MTPWQLPEQAEFGGKRYQIHADFRDILEIFAYFDDPDLPEYLKWRIALALFYEEPICTECMQEAMQFLSDFLKGGNATEEKPAPKVLDWEQDGAMIIADINKVAGKEIRALPFVHWWTFLSWFHAIGEGQLSTVVSIREKLRKGKKLEDWEKDYYREHKQVIDLKKRYSQTEMQERAELEKMLSEKMNKV